MNVDDRGPQNLTRFFDAKRKRSMVCPDVGKRKRVAYVARTRDARRSLESTRTSKRRRRKRRSDLGRCVLSKATAASRDLASQRPRRSTQLRAPRGSAE